MAIENKFILSVADVSDILNFSKSYTYTLFQRDNFPAMLIGKKLCVRTDKFYAWIKEVESGSIIISKKEKSDGRKK